MKILSLGRNLIKKIEKLEDLAKTLEELWLSYNMITTLDGLASLSKLRVLYLGNNRIKNWDELEKLVRQVAAPQCWFLLWRGCLLTWLFRRTASEHCA